MADMRGEIALDDVRAYYQHRNAKLTRPRLFIKDLSPRSVAILTQTARAAQALPLAQAALAVHASTNGPNHPWTKDSARAVAEALDALGRADEAAAVRREHGV